MSTVKTGITDIGFLITDDIAKNLRTSPGGIYDAVKNYDPEFEIHYLRNFTGSIKTITTLKYDKPIKDPINENLTGQDLVYIPIKNMPTLFHQAYHTQEELADEIRNTLADIEIRLADENQYIRNIVIISGIAE